MKLGVLSFFKKLSAGALTLSLVLLAFNAILSETANATTGTNQQINFQGRLFNAQGATVPDGYYNIEFKIYQDGDGQSVGNTTGAPAGSLKWTEDYLNVNGKGIVVKNGFLSVQLGSVTPFGTSVDWNQDTLWLSMNIAGTDTGCATFAACSPDGEMVPMKRLSSAVYAMNASKLNGLTSTQFLQLAQGVQTDASTNTSSIAINKTGTGNLVQLQNNGNDAFTIDNTGNILFGNTANHTIGVATAAADTAGKSLSISGGNAGTGAAALAGGDLALQGGNGGGTNGNGGNLTIDAGAKNGTGTNGSIQIGTTNASSIQIGSAAFATTQTLNIGNNNTAGSTTNVTIGSGSSATGGTTTVQGKGNVSVSSASGTMTITSSGDNTISTSTGKILVTANSDASFNSVAGTIYLGNTSTGAIQVGNNSLATGSQNINIGTNNTAGGTTNVTIGSGSSATGGTTTLQGKGNVSLNSANGNINQTAGNGTWSASASGNVSLSSTAGTLGLASNGNTTISTNGVVRTTFDSSSNSVYFGNGVTAAAPNNFVISGTGSSTTAVAGGSLTVQGGNATAGDANGGNISINGGTKSGTGTDGNVYIGDNNTGNTIQIGNNALASGTQTLNIGSNNTAGGTTNVTIGSGSSATGGSTTVQAKGAISITSANGNISQSAVAGTWTASAYGNSSLSTTNGTLAITGNGDTSITSTTGNISENATASGKTWSATSNGNATLTSNAGNVVLNAAGGAATNLIQLQTNSLTRATFDNTYSMYLGAGVTGANNPFTLMTTSGTAGVAGSALTIKSGTGGSSSAGGALSLQGGAGGSTSGAGGAVTMQGGAGSAGNSNGGDVTINGGIASGAGTNGNIYIGIANAANTIQVGNTANGITQTINIGNNNTAGSTTNVTIGSGSSATAGTTTVQSKNNMTITSASGNISESAVAGTWTVSAYGNSGVTTTNGTLALTGYSNTTLSSTAGTVGISSNGNTTISTASTVRATFDTANSLYLGNGVTAAAPNNFTVSGTGSSTTAVAGGSVNVQGGNATVGSANGGNVTISGGTGTGTGVNGIVVITTPTFSTTTNDANCFTGGALVANSCTITQTSINNSSAVLVGFNTTAKTATMPDPTIATAGRIVYVTAANGTQDFTLSVNGGGMGNQIAMRQNTTATMIWNGSDWTAAGASSSTTLQSAYDNTMQSAGGAELVVSKTGTTNGLTIRDSMTNSVNGTLLTVQNSSAAGLFSVNSNVTEYSSDSGAETAGASASTFPASTWAANGSSTVSRYTTAGDYIATGQAAVSVVTTTAANDGVKNTLTQLTSNMHYNVSFSARLTSGTFTDMNVYYSVDGTTASVVCTTGQAIITSLWTKVNCAFAAPASGITSANAILIRQTGSGTARTFYVDNLSVTVAADYNYATDGTANDSTNFATNWSFVNATSGAGSVSRNSTDGYEASDSAGVTITTGAANAGLRNKLSINPLANTLYRITVYTKLLSGTFTDFKIRYSYDGSTSSSGNFIDCVDYNTQTLSTTAWTKVTCYIKTTSATVTNPYVYFVESTSTARSFYVDSLEVTLSTSTTPNVQIGSGVNGGPTTLFTLDRSASAPVAANNDALLGSMYYDTTLGKLQCYEADGWGACGSSPDNVVTISPEYTNAVLHGTGVGTMTSDICSSTLGINDGTSSQPTICGTNETYNFYKWTSPQASAQTYSIYVSYQLPNTFKEFASGQTSIMGRTDSTNSTVQYQIYRNNSATGLTACGSLSTVSTGSQTSWQVKTASGSADPSTCNFAPGDSVVFKINMIASQNANAYVSNLNFIFSNK